jgi:hypothetical protein
VTPAVGRAKIADVRALSLAVLRTAAELTHSMESGALATFLYVSNWTPLTPSWLARFPGTDAVERFVLAEPEVASYLSVGWRTRHDAHWFHFEPAERPTASPHRYKLYLSPRPASAPDALRRALPVLVDHGAPPFKISRTPRGLLRPDRMVIYFRSLADLHRVGDALADPLGDMPAQGVPFTAALAPSGLTSWGYDPPPSVKAYGASWRQWLTKKLAAYLHASDADHAEGRVQFALSKVAEDGVDPDTWRPTAALWA